MNVRNNREFDAITKEIELQELEMQLADKRMSEAKARIRLIEDDLGNTQGIYNERKEDLKTKKQELDVITSENQEEEKDLRGDRDKQAGKIEERLPVSYTHLDVYKRQCPDSRRPNGR